MKTRTAIAERAGKARPRRRPPEEVQGGLPLDELLAIYDMQNAAGHLIRRCQSRARAIFDQLIGEKSGLSRQQFALMVAIAKNPGAAYARLSEQTGFDRNSLADTLNRLIEKKLVTRQRSVSDARAYEIGLSARGARLLRQLIPLSFEVHARIIEPLPEQMRPIFIACLRVVVGLEHPSDPGETLSLAPASREV
jgi:DNA-binding MarR family transcriptional regulator